MATLTPDVTKGDLFLGAYSGFSGTSGFRNSDDSSDNFSGGSYLHDPVRSSATEIDEIKSLLLQLRETVAMGTGLVRINNDTGAQLDAGTLVTLSSIDSTTLRFTVVKADADDLTNTPAQYVIVNDLANGSDGTAYASYEVTGLDTSAFSAIGDKVYLSQTAGEFTQTDPGGMKSQVIGYVTAVNATTGKIIFVLGTGNGGLGSATLTTLTEFGTSSLAYSGNGMRIEGPIAVSGLAGFSGATTHFAGLLVSDDQTIKIGNDSDGTVKYDSGNDEIRVEGSKEWNFNNRKLGINCSPSAKLQVCSNTASDPTISTDGSDVIVAQDTSGIPSGVGINVLCGFSGTGNFYFGNPGAIHRGGLTYHPDGTDFENDEYFLRAGNNTQIMGFSGTGMEPKVDLKPSDNGRRCGDSTHGWREVFISGGGGGLQYSGTSGTRLDYNAGAGFLQVTRQPVDFQVRTKITDFFALPDEGELTISGGVVTATGSYHTIDTELDAASDNLDTINGGTSGDVLIIQAADDARTVLCKDGVGNLVLAGDFSMDNTQDRLMLHYDGSSWVELSRSDNGT